MDEKKYKLNSLIFNTLIYFIFIIWLLLSMSDKIFNTNYQIYIENSFILGSFLWIVLGVIDLQRSYKEYLDD